MKEKNLIKKFKTKKELKAFYANSRVIVRMNTGTIDMKDKKHESRQLKKRNTQKAWDECDY